MNPQELNVVLADPCRKLGAVKDPFATVDAVLYRTSFFVAFSSAQPSSKLGQARYCSSCRLAPSHQ